MGRVARLGWDEPAPGELMGALAAENDESESDDA